MPGLIQLINALNAYIRMAWAVIWTAMWAVFLYEFYLIIDKFLQYPASVTISLGYKGRAFPMVTICNQNPLRYQIVQKNSTYSELNNIMTTYKQLVQSNYDNISGNPYGVNRYSCGVNSTLFANEQACVKWFESNSAVINIWYDGLDYTLQAEGSSYSLSTASNDLGGQAGLWVGISLVSVIEGVVFIIFIFLYFCFGRKYTDVEITDDIRGADSRYLIMKGFKEELDTQEIMDEEIAIRYRAFKMRDELKRQEKIAEGERLNALAVAKAKQQKKDPGLVQRMLGQGQ
uniref:Amiloride-sensitive sodium channel subunit alpha n=1 Tax=Bursaphelenchus xylophilus TaxID=6326 RepID=A0A1I7SV64_BURXY